MTLPEFLSWQAYAKAKAAEMQRPAGKPDPDTLPELAAIGPAGIAQALR